MKEAFASYELWAFIQFFQKDDAVLHSPFVADKAARAEGLLELYVLPQESAISKKRVEGLTRRLGGAVSAQEMKIVKKRCME